jgi:hypothetical protein
MLKNNLINKLSEKISIEQNKLTIPCLNNEIENAQKRCEEKLLKNLHEYDFESAHSHLNELEELANFKKYIRLITYDFAYKDNKHGELKNYNQDTNNSAVNEKIIYDNRNSLKIEKDLMIENKTKILSLKDSFTWEKPMKFTLFNKSYFINYWKDALIEIYKILQDKDIKKFENYAKKTQLSNKKRVISKENKGYRCPKKAYDYIIETNLDTNRIRELIVEIFDEYNIPLDEIKFYVR